MPGGCAAGACGGPSTCGTTPCFVCFTPPSSATGGPGATCADSSACASGVCDSLRAHCSAPCDDTLSTRDADCTSAMGSGFVCTEETVTIGTASGTLGYCAHACADDAACAGTAGDVCQAFGNSNANRVDLACGPPAAGAAGYAAACTSPDDCGSGICYPSPTSLCSRPCVTKSDCGGALPNCAAILFVLPGGGTQSVNVCSP